MSSHGLKTLQHQRTRAAEEVAAACAKLAEVNQQIADFTSGDLVISEHAQLRYLERVQRIDLDEVNQQIVPNSIRDQIVRQRSGEWSTATHRIRVEDGVVVTVLEARRAEQYVSRAKM